VVVVSVEWVNATHAPQGVCGASFPSVLEPARRCPQRRRRTSEIGDVHGWRLLQPMRRGRSATRGTVRCRPSKRWTARVSWSTREQDHDRVRPGRVDRSWPVRI